MWGLKNLTNVSTVRLEKKHPRKSLQSCLYESCCEQRRAGAELLELPFGVESVPTDQLWKRMEAWAVAF